MLWVVGSLLPLVAGCESRVSLGGRCTMDSECGALRCRFGRCRAECTSAGDCADPAAFCIGNAGAGVCTVPTVDRCESDCTQIGLVCAGELCTTPCATGCLAGSTCDTGANVCVAIPRVDAGPAELDAAPSADTAEHDADLRDAGSLDRSAHTLCVGYEHACVIGSRGRVFCWGNNHASQLGDGLTDHGMGCPWIAVSLDSGVPVDDCDNTRMHAVVARDTGTELVDVVSLDCGRDHTCALGNDGQVWCWGYGDANLGAGPGGVDGSLALTAIASGASELSVGDNHACALVGGAPRCWGHNGVALPDGEGPDGRLGRIDLLESWTPTEATGLAGLTSLSAGGTLTCGVSETGGVHCQGSSTLEGAQPNGRDIAGVTHTTALTVGLHHGCALADEGLVCWGSNASRELGVRTDGLTECASLCRSTAAPVEGSAGQVFSGLSHGASSHTCAIARDTGEVRCWGANPYGESGIDPGPTFTTDVVPMLGASIRRVDGATLDGVVEVAVGGGSCALTASREIWCWGFDNYGQLGFYESGDPGDSRLSRPYFQAHLVTSVIP